MIRTTVIGSWPLPEMYRERLLQYHRGTLPEMLVKPTLVGAAEIAIREQRPLGLPNSWAESSLLKSSFNTSAKADRSEVDKTASPELRAYTDVAEYEVLVTSMPHMDLGYAEAFRREVQLAPDLEKASIPGPLELVSHFVQLAMQKRSLPGH